MRTTHMSLKVVLPAVLAAASSYSAAAETQAARPFSMRGVELGITIDEFRQATIPNDDDEYDQLQTWCSNDELPQHVYLEASSEDEADGIVECQWFSTLKALSYDSLSAHGIDIGSGAGFPLFKFVPSGDQLRLFRIFLYANNEYHSAILDALTRGYGAPKVTVEPFQTMSGSEFTSATAVWDNGLSTITLVERCGHLERYCLTYDHSALSGAYEDLQEQRAAEAATRI